MSYLLISFLVMGSCSGIGALGKKLRSKPRSVRGSLTENNNNLWWRYSPKVIQNKEERDSLGFPISQRKTDLRNTLKLEN